MSTGQRLHLVVGFFGLPFIIAAAFKFTDWMGWPALIVFGIYWIGILAHIGSKE